MLAEKIFLAAGILYFAISVKVNLWKTQVHLNMRYLTPLAFQQGSPIYSIRHLFFLVALAASSPLLAGPWYLWPSVLAVLWILPVFVGKKRAFNCYRKMCIELADESSDKQQVDYWIEQAKIPDWKIFQIELKNKRSKSYI